MLQCYVSSKNRRPSESRSDTPSFASTFRFFLWASSCYGAIYESVADLLGTKFDFVVVGGMLYLVTHREPI